MADQTRINTLVVRSQLEGIDQAKAQIAGLGSQFDQTAKSLDTMGAKQDAWREHLNALAQGLSTTGDHLSGISSKLDMTARAAGAASLAFDSIGMDPLSAGAAQLSGRISEVSEGFDALSGLASKSADAIGTHTDALSQAVDRYRELSEAQQDSSDASSMSTAGWVAAGVAGVALVGVTAGVVVGVMAAKDALLAAADATGLWAKEVLTGGILDNMEKLVATGHQLNDISTTTGVAAQNFSILATGLQGSGLSADTTQHLLTGLQKTLVDTSSQAVEARITMREMGIDLESVGKNGNDAQSVFLAVAGTLSQYQDGAEKTALAQKLLGDSSAEVIKGVDGAVDAYSRIDAQTRANIANTAAYAAATDDMIAKFKDLRDLQPPTPFQSQMSGGFAEVGGGFKQLAAGFNWGAGLFSHAGRDVMSAGITDIEKGFSVLWNTVDESWSKVNLTTTSWVDKIFGTHQADEVRERLQNLSATIADNMPKPGADTRSELHGDPYGSYAWATSSATQLAAQYDPATAALATYAENYGHILDLYKIGKLGAEAFNQALQEQTDAFLKASDPVGTYVANLQKVLDIKAANVPGPARDAALQKQQIVDSLKSSVKRPLTGGELSSIDGIVSQTTDQNAADQAYQKAQSDAQSAAAQAKANAESARQTIQNVGLQADAQDRLTAAIGKGWLAQQQADAENQIASAVAQNGAINQNALRAAYDAVTSAKQRNIDASTGDKLQQELDLAKLTADAHQQGAAAIADLAIQTGHYQDVLAGVSPAQQAVNDNLRQQIEYQKEISAASDYGRNLQNETDIAQKQLDILTQTKGVRTQEVEALKQRLQIEQQFPNIDAATRSSLIFQADQLAEVKGRVQDITKAYQEQQREIQQVSDQIANSLGNGITDALKNGTSAWDKMLKSWHSMLDTFMGQMAAQFLKTEIVVPIVAQVVGGHAASMMGGAAPGIMGGGGSSGIGDLLNLGSTANTVSGWFGGPSISGSSIFGSQGLGITGEGGYLSQAGSYLFGNAATPGIGASAGLMPGDIVAGETLTSSDFAAPASEGLFSSGGASGFLASGAGTAVGALGTIGGGALAGMMLGNMVGTGAGGAAAGTAGGAATGMAIGSVVPGIGTAIGAVVGAVTGALSGFFSGLAPKADNSNTWTGITDGQGSIINETQSHGGNKTATDAMAKAFNTTLNSVAQSLGAKLDYNGVVENFGYTAKYKKFSSSEGQFDSAQDAVNHALAAQLTDPTIWKGLSDNVVKAMDASKGQSLDQITKNLDFANNFDAAIKAMKSGVTDFSKSAESAALTLGTTLTTQIENFKSQASALGLDTQAAADATKNAVEVFLGLKNTQPISDLEKSVETLYGKLQGVQGLISDVGISQTDATASVKAQIEQMLGITAASPPVSALDTQIASLKQTFANLAPILTTLGVSSDDVAQALQKQIDAAKAAAAVTDQAAIWTAQGNQSLVQLQTILSSLSAGALGNSVGTAQLTGVLGGMTPDQIGQAVSQFGDATKVGAGAADSFLSLADSVLASKAAAERNAEAVSKATGDLNFFTNAAKSLSNYASGLTVSSASPLSPYDQYQAAKAKFESDQALAKTGDQTAIGSLQTDAQAFLAASKAYNASNQQYAADFREVQQGISSAASYAQAQAALEQKIIDTLNVPILDQLKAIEAAIQIQAAKNGSTGSFGGVGGSGIGGTPGGMNIGVASAIVTADYWSILGRAPDQGGLAGYAADIAGGSFTPQQIADAMRSSPEYLATHSHAKGGVASGWSLVGEQGPEWAYFGQPAQIFPHGTGGPSAVNDNSAAAEIRELRAQVDRLIQLIAAGTLRQIDAISEQSTHLRQIASASSRSAANPLGRRV